MANPEDLGRYRLKRLLGRGALGEVWEANDLEQEGSKVAVKIMHAADDELALARNHFAREARLVAQMRHRNVVEVHDAGEAAGTSFLVMEMVEGVGLRTAVKDPATTSEDKLRWVREIADGLAALHRVGVVHRDVKPENVLIRPDRSACLVDLGIAKWTRFDLGAELDPADAIEAMATEPKAPSLYVPPETIDDGIYDEQGDQYAWAVIAYEVITGAAPTKDSPPLVELKDLPVPIPADVARAIDRARSKDREARWDAMDPLLRAIGSAASKTAAETRSADTVPPPSATEPRAAPGREGEAKDEPEAGEATTGRASPVTIGIAVVIAVFVLGVLVAALR
jgi:eukaryotic-like serine/threonine-protein kinase